MKLLSLHPEREREREREHKRENIELLTEFGREIAADKPKWERLKPAGGIPSFSSVGKSFYSFIIIILYFFCLV